MLSHGTPWVNLDVVGPEIAALQARVAELEAAREWRDIATAPEDGTLVLTIDCGFCCDVGWFDPEYDGWVNECEVIFPTHWMPLPESPTEDAPR